MQLVVQLCYYIYLCGDPASAAQFLEQTYKYYPNDPQILLNLGVVLSKSGQWGLATSYTKKLLKIEPHNLVAWDTLCSCLYRLGDYQAAYEAGTRSLELKKKKCQPAPDSWRLPAQEPTEWLKKAPAINIMAFAMG